MYAPQVFVIDEMAERGWNAAQLGEAAELDEVTIAGFLSYRAGVTVDLAAGLARAFGTSEKLWLNLQDAADKAFDDALHAEWQRRYCIGCRPPPGVAGAPPVRPSTSRCTCDVEPDPGCRRHQRVAPPPHGEEQ